VSSDPTRYPPTLLEWFEGDTRGAKYARYLVYALGAMLLTLAASLVQRWTGQPVAVPPPPVTVVVQPQDGAPPAVTVFQGSEIGAKP
jgi:hypothetical protein